jgi:regulatory protein YycI of two-component signal transduction system YycFG
MEILQMWFYIIGIIFMVTFILFFVALGIALWEIKKAAQKVPERVESGITSLLANNKFQLVSMIGVPVATFLLGKVRSVLFKR